MREPPAADPLDLWRCVDDAVAREAARSRVADIGSGPRIAMPPAPRPRPAARGVRRASAKDKTLEQA